MLCGTIACLDLRPLELGRATPSSGSRKSDVVIFTSPKDPATEMIGGVMFMPDADHEAVVPQEVSDLYG